VIYAIFILAALWAARMTRTVQGWRKNTKAMLSSMAAAGELSGMAPGLLFAVFSLESGDGQGSIYGATRNLASLKTGAATEWIGKLGDPVNGFRTYESDHSAALDFVSWMGWTKYRAAQTAARAGDAPAFFLALEKSGFEVALNPPYSQRLYDRWVSLGMPI
jgi:hypothetical protein